MQVFGALLSPFVRKVCLVAEEKGIAYELVMTEPGNPNPDFVAASPFGKIPAMKDGDYSLADSTAIVTYLEAKYPAHPMLPADPQARGRAMWFDEFADTILAGAGLKILFNRLVGPKILKVGGDEAIALQGEAELPRILAYLEGTAPKQRLAAGREFHAWRIFRSPRCSARWPMSATRPEAEAHPRTAAWYARVCGAACAGRRGRRRRRGSPRGWGAATLRANGTDRRRPWRVLGHLSRPALPRQARQTPPCHRPLRQSARRPELKRQSRAQRPLPAPRAIFAPPLRP